MAVRLLDERLDARAVAWDRELDQAGRDLRGDVGQGDPREDAPASRAERDGGGEDKPDRAVGAEVCEPAEDGIEKRDAVTGDPASRCRSQLRPAEPSTAVGLEVFGGAQQPAG